MKADSITKARQHIEEAELALKGLNKEIESMEETVRKMEELFNKYKKGGIAR